VFFLKIFPPSCDNYCRAVLLQDLGDFRVINKKKEKEKKKE
jgi:hypothetical protein